jgi:uncharacterized membrane protein
MRLLRWMKHVLRSPKAVDRALPPQALARIEQEIADGEARHRGELRLAVEASLPWSYLKRDAPVRERAEMLFAKLRVWDTDERNGVLIYVELADHGIEIVADRGAARAIAADAWAPIVDAMAERFAAAEFEAGIATGIGEVSRLLAQAFPAAEGRQNADELPNRPVVVGR